MASHSVDVPPNFAERVKGRMDEQFATLLIRVASAGSTGVEQANEITQGDLSIEGSQSLI
jgi:hypothetical protein